MTNFSDIQAITAARDTMDTASARTIARENEMLSARKGIRTMIVMTAMFNHFLSLSAVTTRHRCPTAVTTPAAMGTMPQKSRPAIVSSDTTHTYRRSTTRSTVAGSTNDDRRPRSFNTSLTSGWKLKLHFFVHKSFSLIYRQIEILASASSHFFDGERSRE